MLLLVVLRNIQLKKNLLALKYCFGFFKWRKYKCMKEDIKLFNKIVDQFLYEESKSPVTEYIEPKHLKNKVDISLSDQPIEKEEFENIVTDLVLKTPKTASKMFFNQLFGGRKSKAVLGDLLAALLNSSMYTYKVAGVHSRRRKRKSSSR